MEGERHLVRGLDLCGTEMTVSETLAILNRRESDPAALPLVVRGLLSGRRVLACCTASMRFRAQWLAAGESAPFRQAGKAVPQLQSP